MRHTQKQSRTENLHAATQVWDKATPRAPHATTQTRNIVHITTPWMNQGAASAGATTREAITARPSSLIDMGNGGVATAAAWRQQQAAQQQR